jgi:hypothetical protein
MSGLVDRSDLQLLRVAAFLAVLVLLLALVPFALGLGGVDIRGTADAPDGGTLVVLSATGDAPADEGTSLGTVELDVAAGAHTEPVDLDRVTVFWVANRTYRVTAPDATGGNGTFAIDGDSVLENGERARLRFDLGSDDIDGAEEFGERLSAGESVRIVVLTGTESTERELTVPDPIGDAPVSL